MYNWVNVKKYFEGVFMIEGIYWNYIPFFNLNFWKIGNLN